MAKNYEEPTVKVINFSDSTGDVLTGDILTISNGYLDNNTDGGFSE